MNILVCISRVPDTSTKVTIGDDKKSIDSKGVKYVLNPYDDFAIEEGLQLKQKNSGSEVTALTIGSEENKDILRTALAMGADKAVLVKTSDDFDSYFVAKNIADYAKKINADLVLLGKQSVDFDSLQVPSLVGEMLDIPSISVVSKLEIDGDSVKAERDIEGGKEVLESSLPIVISAQKGLNQPRYPKLPDIMKAKRKPIEEIDALDADKKVSVVGMEIPSRERLNKILTDSDADLDELVRSLHEDAKVI